MQRKQREDELKELDKKQKAERLLQLKNEKDKKIDEIKQEEIKQDRRQRLATGILSTVMFIAFWIQHIMLASTQYQVDNQWLFGNACVVQIFPNLDPTQPIHPQIFLSRTEAENYFL